MLTRGSHRPRRRVLCANSASLGKTQSTPSPSPRRKLEDAGRKKGQRGKQTLSALLCSGPPTLAPPQGAQGPIQPPPPLPSAWPPLHTVTHPSWATKTTTPHRRTRTQKAMTQERKGTTLMMTPHSSLIGVEWRSDDWNLAATTLFSFTYKRIFLLSGVLLSHCTLK